MCSLNPEDEERDGESGLLEGKNVRRRREGKRRRTEGMKEGGRRGEDDEIEGKGDG